MVQNHANWKFCAKKVNKAFFKVVQDGFLPSKKISAPAKQLGRLEYGCRVASFYGGSARCSERREAAASPWPLVDLPASRFIMLFTFCLALMTLKNGM